MRGDYLYGRVSNLPVLTTEEQADLIREYQDHGNMAAREKVINGSIRFVYSLAAPLTYGTIQIQDLVSEGVIGLITSLEKFNLKRGVRLETFAKKEITRNMWQFIMDNQKIMRVGTTHRHKRLFFNFKSLRPDTSVGITESEAKNIAEKLNVPVRDVYEMELVLCGEVQSFHTSGDDSDHLSPEDVLEGHDKPTDYIDKEFHDLAMTAVVEAVSALEGRRQEIFTKRLLVDKRITTYQLADEYGVTPQAIDMVRRTAFDHVKEKVLTTMGMNG